MFVPRKIIVGTILCVFKCIFSDPLTGIKDFYSSSQVLYSHCALIPAQKFFPSSCELRFSSGKKNIEFKYASLFSFEENGFAFGYRILENSGNIVSAAYGLQRDFFYFGAGFNIHFKKSAPSLLTNVSTAFELSESNRIVLSGNNIGNHLKENMYPVVILENAGLISRQIPISYDLGISHSFDKNQILDQTSGLTLYFKSKLLNQPGIFYSIGYELLKEKKYLMHHTLGVSLGVLGSFTENGIGFFLGYSYDFFDKSNDVQCRFHYNPFEFSDVLPPVPTINVTCGSGNTTGFFVSVHCTDNEGGSGIKSWTLIFSDGPGKEAKIYKIFSGGNTIPSTIYWDLRDKNGSVLDTLSFYTRIVVIDNKKNVGYSPWFFLEACR